MTSPKKTCWYQDGLRFECQGSGRCCLNRGKYGYVFVTLPDRRALASLLGVSTAAFTRRFCEKSDGRFHLKDRRGGDACFFLEGARCAVYEARPTQCRTWPFWPELLNAKAWKRVVASYCEGAGKGRLWTREEIERVAEQQRRSDEELEK